MISCTEFIPAYSELFAFIDERYGRAELVRFWEELADEFLFNLRDLVAEKGLQGMHEYWSHTLSEEGADCRIVLSDDEFRIEMDHCPSTAILRRNEHITPFADYCEHCKVLYKHVIEPYGFRCETTVADPVMGKCVVRVTKGGSE